MSPLTSILSPAFAEAASHRQAPRGEEALGGVFSEKEPRRFFSSARVRTHGGCLPKATHGENEKVNKYRCIALEE